MMVIGRRRIAFLVGLLALAGVATMVPSPVAAGAGSIGTCQLVTDDAGRFEVGIHTRGSGPVTRIELELHISADGEAEASGMVVMENPIAVLERGTGWQVSCADLDGDNLRGIVKVRGSLDDARTREPFGVVITPEQEVDTSGSYLTAIEITSADGQTRSQELYVFVREPRASGL